MQGNKKTRGQEDERTRQNKRGRIALNSPTQHCELFIKERVSPTMNCKL